MLIGVIADDFTGAGDIANTLARGLPGEGGLRVAQFTETPEGPAPEGIEAGVIALKTRSIAAGDAVRQSLQALDWLLAQGCRQIVFKYCSTFDSTAEGNIGPVAEALADRMGVVGVVVCPAFPAMGRTIYQGHLFVADRLLSESGMRHHPLTPMTDPDLRRWLALQSRDPVGLVPLRIVRQGAEAIGASLREAALAGDRLVVTDATSDEDLLALALALRDAPLVTGGSGIAIGLPANFIRAGMARGEQPDFVGLPGRGVVLAGSCSGATLGQIAAYSRHRPAMMLDVPAVMAGSLGVEEICDFVQRHADQEPLVYSSAMPEEVSGMQSRYRREVVSERLETLFGTVACRLEAAGFSRIVVAGGETSGAVTQALRPGALWIGPEIATGVPLLLGRDGRLALVLKSGNFGGPDFFSEAQRITREGVTCQMPIS